MACLGLLSGCTRQKKEVPTTDVRPVTAYGVTLDSDASPQQVSYVLLRSLKDDVTAAQTGQHEEQKAAEKLTFSLAAPTKIEERVVRTLKQLRPGMSESAVKEERDQRLYEVIHYWAPIVGHYITSFDDTLEAAAAKMWVTTDPSRTDAHVYFPVSHDPSVTDPAEAETATLDIEMAREKAAGKEYWRVVRLSYLGRQVRKVTPGLIVEAHGLTLDGSASPQQTAYVAVRALAEAVRSRAAGHRDLPVSSEYRLRLLAVPSVTTQPAGPGGGEEPQGAANLVAQWQAQIEPIADRIDVDPTAGLARMQATSAGSPPETAVVRYLLPPVASSDSGDAAIVVELAAQKSGTLSFWRVVSIRREGGSPAVAPATQPAVAPVTTS